MPEGAPANLKRGGGPRNAVERRWWLWGLAREMHRLHADVVHGPDFAVPYLPRRPSVLTLHDLSPWMDESWHHAADRVTAAHSGAAGTGRRDHDRSRPSEAVRQQAIERFRLRPDRVVAMPECGARVVAARSATGDKPAPRIFCSWARWSRARICPRCWMPGAKCARDHAVDLVLAGRRRADFAALAAGTGIARPGRSSGRGNCRSSTPARWRSFIRPSTRVSDCRCWRPCSAARASSRREAVAEVGGRCRHLTPSGRERTCRRHARRWLDAGMSWLHARRADSLARAREFSWERTARLTHEVYQEARSRFGD